jgi:hypothetical protein
MNRIRDNLRLDVSQPWAAWALFGGAVGVYVSLVLLEALGALRGRFGAFTLSEWWAQMLVLGAVPAGGSTRHEPLAAPLSFTLPGYRESLRRSSFVRAVRWGVIFALFLFSFTWGRRQFFWDWPADVPKPSDAIANFREISLNMMGAFLGGMAIGLFWINSALVWFRRRWLALLFVGIVIAIFHAALSATFFHHTIAWVVAVPLSVFFCWFFWWRLGDPEWTKNAQRGILVHKTGGSYGIGVRTRVVSCTCKVGGPREPEARTTVSFWREYLFVDGMRQGASPAAARYVWGWFYRVFGPILTRWKWIVVSLVAGALVLGYVNRLYADIVFLFLGIHVASSVWYDSSTLLLPEGRGEKYYLTIASGVAATLLLMAASTGAVVLSRLFALLIPPLSLGTYHLQYTGLSMRSVWLACLPVPWFPILLLVMMLVVLSLRLVLPFLILLAVIFLVAGQIRAFHVGPSFLPVLLACGWVFFLFVAWTKYRRWDLANG